MAKPQIPTTTVRIPKFASAELTELVDELYTKGKGFKVEREGDVVAALVLAARRSPIEAVAAVILSYWERETEEAAKIAAQGPREN